MKNLPAVMTDYKNARNLSKMIGIQDENIKVLKDASNQDVTELLKWFSKRMKVLTKPLRNETGITTASIHAGGVLWEDIKKNKRNFIAPFDFVEI